MSLEITQFYETEFGKNWEMLAQQKDSKLVSAVSSDSFRGKRKWYNQLDVGSMQEVTERKGDTPDGDSTGLKYWIYRRKFEFVKTWDEDDEMQLGSIALPDSDEIASFAAAEARTKDDVIISSAFGSRMIGENGTDAEAFNTAATQEVVANLGGGANTGLTLAKVLRAKKILDENEVEDSDRYLVVKSQQIEEMLNLEKLTSGDYVQVKALVDGTITRFAGFNWVRSERLSTSAGDITSAMAFHKSAIKFADAGRQVHIDMLPSKRHCKQLRGVARMGAVRTEDKRIVRVLCDNSP